jgi:diguanylate cyclase (GGDEF)-like protein
MVAGKAAARHLAMLAVVLLVTVLALLWLLGRALDRNATASADSQLVGDVQVARTTLQADVTITRHRGNALAHLARVQEALVRRDLDALRALAASHPGSQIVTRDGVTAGTLAPLGVRRVVDVVVGGRTIGRIVTEAALDSEYLGRVRANLPAGAHDLLAVANGDRVVAGDVATGTHLRAPTARYLHVRGHRYRALAASLVGDEPSLEIVVLTPRSKSFVSNWRVPLALFVTIFAVGLLVLLTGAPSRAPAPPPVDEPEQEPPAEVGVAQLGEQLAAANDVDALLRVVLDAAIKATGAAGGRIARRGEDASRLGESENQLLRVPLDTTEGSDAASLLLYPPESGFPAGAADVARWLGVHASTALRDVSSHSVEPEERAGDDLTGLASRAGFTAALQLEFARAAESATSLSVLLVDLDDFKSVNDRVGRRAGDELLKTFGETLRRSAREIGLAARIAGEQFAVLLPHTDADGARQFAERLRAELHARRDLPDFVTASFGGASYPGVATAEELLLSADRALRAAKSAGKDRVVVGSDPGPARV